MFVENKKAGIGHFIIAVLLICVVGLIGANISYVLPNLKLVSDIIVFGMLCVVAYFVLIHYTAVYEYKISDYKIYISRTIASRTSTIEIDIKDIKGIYNSCKTAGKKVNMGVNVISMKNKKNIVYTQDNKNKSVWFEPSDEFINKLNTLINEMEKTND